jgi:hypothetical protein
MYIVYEFKRRQAVSTQLPDVFCAPRIRAVCRWDDELVLPARKPFHHSLTKTHPGIVRMITVYFFLSLPLFGEHEEAIPKEIVLPESAA